MILDFFFFVEGRMKKIKMTEIPIGVCFLFSILVTLSFLLLLLVLF